MLPRNTARMRDCSHITEILLKLCLNQTQKGAIVLVVTGSSLCNEQVFPVYTPVYRWFSSHVHHKNTIHSEHDTVSAWTNIA